MFCLKAYGRFLRISNVAIATAVIMAITEGIRYIIRSVVVAKFAWETGVDAGVGAAESTAKLVAEDDP